MKISVPEGFVPVRVAGYYDEAERFHAGAFDTIDDRALGSMLHAVADPTPRAQCRAELVRVVPQALIDEFAAMEERHAKERAEHAQRLLASPRMTVTVTIVPA